MYFYSDSQTHRGKIRGEIGCSVFHKVFFSKIAKFNTTLSSSTSSLPTTSEHNDLPKISNPIASNLNYPVTMNATMAYLFKLLILLNSMLSQSEGHPFTLGSAPPTKVLAPAEAIPVEQSDTNANQAINTVALSDDGAASSNSVSQDQGGSKDLLNTASPPVATITHTESVPGGTKVTKAFMVNGESRTYNLFIPNSYDPKKQTPLVIAFHGGGSNNESFEESTQFDKVVAEQGCIVVYPEASAGNKKHWNDGRTSVDKTNDVQFTDMMLQQIKQDYNVDNKKVYLTGKSNGGNFANYYAQQRGDQIAAVASVASSIPVQNADIHSDQPVSVMMINGTEDPVMPYLGGEMNSKYGGAILSHQKAIDKWIQDNGGLLPKGKGPLYTEADLDPTDGSTVTRQNYHTKSGAIVTSIDVIGGGHTWPGSKSAVKDDSKGATNQDWNASEEIWNFFNKHPKIG